MINRLFIYSFRYVVMILFSVIVLLPFIWMFFSSFRMHEEIFKYTSFQWQLFLPVDWTFHNYIDLFTDPSKPFGRVILNSLLVSLTVTALGLLVNSLAAFAFGKLHFRMKKYVFALFLSSLVIPYEVTMIPLYMLVRDLGWINSYEALIFPQIVWVFGVFLLTQFYAEIPRDILDAARMDGATWLQVYWRIAVPTAVPAMITLALLTFLNQWDAFLWPLIVINDEKKQMIQVVISSFQSLRGISWGKILAASSVGSIPILVLFLFLQKYYVQGVTQSGVKG
ncbi:carbohydrate ABC transporter permease [Paenibacillus sp.]|uniref:carbohydrate ABC transporter permease n=1 Tax=Paenibacillus sp. TaxID=58172 RepID=UPI002D67F79B|nr:carbohydrate ABC transporter permease [Paenibacillus sp.]HZG58855.1 carbohydrate ABC transporter permease [Paenibacillus sp.]